MSKIRDFTDISERLHNLKYTLKGEIEIWRMEYNPNTKTLITVTDSDIVNGEFKFPEGVEIIGEHAFSRCRKLKHVVIPATVVRINPLAFTDCYSLGSIEIKERVKSIGWGAFWNCLSLTTVHLPSTIEYIGDFASPFAYCSKLKNIFIESSQDDIERIKMLLPEECRQKIVNRSDYEKVKAIREQVISNVIQAEYSNERFALLTSQPLLTNNKTLPPELFQLINKYGYKRLNGFKKKIMCIPYRNPKQYEEDTRARLEAELEALKIRSEKERYTYTKRLKLGIKKLEDLIQTEEANPCALTLFSRQNELHKFKALKSLIEKLLRFENKGETIKTSIDELTLMKKYRFFDDTFKQFPQKITVDDTPPQTFEAYTGNRLNS